MSDDFYRVDPTPRASWRLAVLMGANTRTYKFALGDALLTLAAEGRTDAPLSELATHYAMGLVRHLETPQASKNSELGENDFLTIAEREAAESRQLGQPTELLLKAAMENMQGMVMQKFHNLGGSEVSHRFYELTRTGRGRIVRFSPELQKVAQSKDAELLRDELDARWSIVESSFAAEIGRSLIEEGVAVDLESLRIRDKVRRRSIAGVREATIGFQHGRCLICDDLVVASDEYAIDHVFPFAIKKRIPDWKWPDLDSFWNLAPAHARCNGDKGDRLPNEKEMRRLAERNEAIMRSPHPLRKTLENILRNNAYPTKAGSWREFVRNVNNKIHY